jgi:hypothetical protein
MVTHIVCHLKEMLCFLFVLYSLLTSTKSKISESTQKKVLYPLYFLYCFYKISESSSQSYVRIFVLPSCLHINIDCCYSLFLLLFEPIYL